MTLQSVLYKVIECDHEGCTNELVLKDVGDATTARVRAGIAGWAYRAHKPGPNARLSRDYCPDHAQEAAA